MLEKCSNLDCDLPFDYREGRLIRFCPADAKSPGQYRCVEHFWLCGKCSERYGLAYERGAGMKNRVGCRRPTNLARFRIPLKKDQFLPDPLCREPDRASGFHKTAKRIGCEGLQPSGLLVLPFSLLLIRAAA
jgi:hypothetical protein